MKFRTISFISQFWSCWNCSWTHERIGPTSTIITATLSIVMLSMQIDFFKHLESFFRSGFNGILLIVNLGLERYDIECSNLTRKPISFRPKFENTSSMIVSSSIFYFIFIVSLTSFSFAWRQKHPKKLSFQTKTVFLRESDDILRIRFRSEFASLNSQDGTFIPDCLWMDCWRLFIWITMASTQPLTLYF